MTSKAHPVVDEELIEKYKNYNIFIGDIIRQPKVDNISAGTTNGINIKSRILAIM